MQIRNHKGASVARALAFLGAMAGYAITAQPALAAAAAAVRSSCSDEVTTISGDFEAAAYARCEVVKRGQFKLTIAPEDGKVTNCSPWYAFELNSSQSQAVSIELDYASCGHRYRPKFRVDGGDWQALPLQDVSVETAKGKTSGGGKPIQNATLRLNLPKGKVQVAAQPLFLTKDHAAWLDRVSTLPSVSRSLLGKSREGRPIERITIREPGESPVRHVVLTGRQHPPETTGAIAMQAFIERLLEDDSLARRYRTRYATDAVPLLNPDGVARGHWRHNLGELDLNRDWGGFTQPETQLMRDLLASLSQPDGHRLRLFFDFHSTHHDTIYTLTDDQVTSPAGFTAKWLSTFQAMIPEKKLRIDPGYNRGLPTSKTWVYEAYKMPTATYEVGDETNPAEIRRDARAGAEAMMLTLLAIDE
ncbi:M14 family metallopeptidase [Massilia sp. TS11]|uniref:M14 family metallopeptidase n=1 Tax=Massilia sp. TS11 TaxID=2908003 RepID=UPI001EDA5786|nr:M14 family metallopeptidase [Massilia sp. TS11]MCG2586837.1 M14 family metallopeptidase [Massilia sp. TS11]